LWWAPTQQLTIGFTQITSTCLLVAESIGEFLKVGIIGNTLVSCGMSMQIIETAKVLPKGQITIPKDVRLALGVDTGDRVMLVSDGDRIVMMNPAMYAVQWLGEQMHGKAEEAGFESEDDVADYITHIRREARSA